MALEQTFEVAFRGPSHVQFYYFLNLYATVLYHYAVYGDLCSEPPGSVSLTEEVT